MNFEGSALLGDSGPAGPSPLPGQAPERGEEPVSGTGLLPLPLPLHQRVPLDAAPGGRVSGGGSIPRTSKELHCFKGFQLGLLVNP